LSFAVVSHLPPLKARIDKKGIGAAGSGLGGLILSNVTRVTLEKYGVKWSLIINGLISLVCLVPTIILFKSRHKKVGSRVASFQMKWLVHPGYIWVLLWGFFSRMFHSTSPTPSALSLISSSDVLYRPILTCILRNIRSRSHPDPRRSSSIDSLRSSDARSTSVGYRPRLWRTNQHDSNMLLHIWTLMPRNLATSKLIRCSHLLRPCSGIHGRNDLVGCYSDHSSNSGCQRCFFGAGHLLGGLRAECTSWSAYCGCAIRVFTETAGKARGRSVLHFHWVMWGHGYVECILSVRSKAISAGRLEGTENYISRVLLN
jgi:hypothetical protein